MRTRTARLERSTHYIFILLFAQRNSKRIKAERSGNTEYGMYLTDDSHQKCNNNNNNDNDKENKRESEDDSLIRIQKNS